LQQKRSGSEKYREESLANHDPNLQTSEALCQT